MVDVNKPKIIRNSGELTHLDYLPTKQKMQNISKMRTRVPLVYWGPLNNTRIHFKQALNHGDLRLTVHYLIINFYLVGNDTELIEIHYRLMVFSWHLLHVF